MINKSLYFAAILAVTLFFSANTCLAHSGGWHGGGGYSRSWHSGGWHHGGWYYHNDDWFWGGVAAALVVGTMVATLPQYHETVYVNGAPYYYSNNVYYQPTSNGYVVVNPPTVIHSSTIITEYEDVDDDE